MNVLGQYAISSSVLLSVPPRRLSHCPIGMLSDNYIVISSALSIDHPYLLLKPSDRSIRSMRESGEFEEI